MTNKKTVSSNTDGGEARLRVRRRRLIIVVAALLVSGFIFGLTLGFVDGAAMALPSWLAFGIVAVFIAFAGWLSWLYYRIVDELDLKDNFIACMVGFFGYSFGYPSWKWLAAVGAVPPVDPDGLFFMVLGLTIITYSVLKIRR